MNDTLSAHHDQEPNPPPLRPREKEPKQSIGRDAQGLAYYLKAAHGLSSAEAKYGSAETMAELASRLKATHEEMATDDFNEARDWSTLVSKFDDLKSKPDAYQDILAALNNSREGSKKLKLENLNQDAERIVELDLSNNQKPEEIIGTLDTLAALERRAKNLGDKIAYGLNQSQTYAEAATIAQDIFERITEADERKVVFTMKERFLPKKVANVIAAKLYQPGERELN